MPGKKKWAEEEKSILIDRFADAPTRDIADLLNRTYSQVSNQATVLGLKKSKEFMASGLSGRFKNGLNEGKRFRFEKGHIPANKGKKWSDYMSHEAINNCMKTVFPKNNLPHNTKYDGAISIRKDKLKNGTVREYQYIRLSKGKWKPLHVKVWEDTYGDVPQNHIVIFRDGNTMNCDISNLHLISREENIRRNTLHRLPEELKDVIYANIRLDRKIKKLLQNEKQDKRPA